MLASVVLTVMTVAAQSPQAPTPQPGSPAPVASTSSQAPAGRGPALPELTCPELGTALRGVAANDIRLRDWPQLNRYRESNRSVKTTDAVFMGDSITDNWQQPRFGGFFTGKNYVDRGISGQ